MARTIALLLGCHRGLLSGIPPREQPVLGMGLLLLLLLLLRQPGAVPLPFPFPCWDRGEAGGILLTVHDR
jgi:hypothetical protein